MVTEVSYKPEFVDMLAALVGIQNQVIIAPEENAIQVGMQDENASLAYILRAPREYFNISEELGVYDFKEFYSYYKTSKNIKIATDNTSILMRGDGLKIAYRKSNCNMIRDNSLDEVDFPSTDISFAISVGARSEIVKLVELVGADIINLSVKPDDNVVVLGINNNDKSNSIERTFAIEEKKEGLKPFSLDVYADAIKKLPSGKDYRIVVGNKQFVKISMIPTDDMELNVYTAQVEIY